VVWSGLQLHSAVHTSHPSQHHSTLPAQNYAAIFRSESGLYMASVAFRDCLIVSCEGAECGIRLVLCWASVQTAMNERVHSSLSLHTIEVPCMWLLRCMNAIQYTIWSLIVPLRAHCGLALCVCVFLMQTLHCIHFPAVISEATT